MPTENFKSKIIESQAREEESRRDKSKKPIIYKFTTMKVSPSNEIFPPKSNKIKCV